MNWFSAESFEELQRVFDFNNGHLTAAERQKKTRIECEKLQLGAVNELFKMFSARSMDSKRRSSLLEKCERVRDLLGTSNPLRVPGFKKGAQFVFHLTKLVAIACTEVILDLSMNKEQKVQYGHLFSQLKTDLKTALDTFEDRKEHPKKILLQEFVRVFQNLSRNCQPNAMSWTATPPSIINTLSTVHTRVNKQLNSPEGPSFGWSKSCTALKDILVEVNKILDKYLNFDLGLTLLEDPVPGSSSNSFLSDTGLKTAEFEPHYLFVDDQPNGSHFPCYKYQVPWMTPELAESCSQFFSPVDPWFLEDDDNSDQISEYISQDVNVSTTVVLSSSILEEEPVFKKPKLGC